MKHIIIVIFVLFLIPVASAQYSSDGFNLNAIKHDVIAGGVYVNGGHGVGTSPYSEVFENVPDGVTFARLYVGVKGGTKEATGWVTVVFNEHDLGTISLEGINDTNPNVYCSGNGEYWIYYDVTNHIANSNAVTITTGGEIDGRVKGTSLVAVYNDPSETDKEFWICEGNINLNYRTGHDDETIRFDGTITDEVKSATLWTMYLSGNEGVNDTLTFNNHLIAEDAADGGRMENGVHKWRDLCFDLDCWNVTDYSQSSNNITFDRGIDGYLQPVGAVLIMEYQNGHDGDSYTADNPLTTYRHGTLTGDLVYTIGDSKYSGRLHPNATYTVDFDIELPEQATVEFARLYAYWTWSYIEANGTYPDMRVSFAGEEINPDQTFTDRKGRPPYDYPAGTYCYDVTDQVRSGGTYTAVVENAASDFKKFSMDGIGLLVVYNDPDGGEIEYWIKEGCDIIYADKKGNITPEEATTKLVFEGEIHPDNVKRAILTTVVASGDKGENALLFNKKRYDGVYTGNPYRDLAIDERDVREHLIAQDNMVRIEDDGDYMIPSNAFLVVYHGSHPSSQSTPGFESLFTILTILVLIIVAKRMS